MSAANTLVFTIAATETVSDIQEVPAGHELVGFMLPAMTGTDVTIQAGFDTTTLSYVYVVNGASTNTKVTLTADATGRYVLLDNVRGFRYLKLTSGSAEAAARTIYGICVAC